jgi:hypothetical protein
MYFCTAADETYYPFLLNLLGSIFKYNNQHVKEVAVFDLGMSSDQKNEINKIDRVKIYEVEKINPLIIEPLYSNKDRWIKGLFSWKPVIIKQSLEMFPYVLYLDAGTTILNSLEDLFSHINENGYFFTDCGHSIRWMTTEYVVNKLNLRSESNEWILNHDTYGVDAGLIGVNRSMLDTLVTPMVSLAREIQNFIDDGTCPDGWGTARHDQSLFSIKAKQLNLYIPNHDRDNEQCLLKFNNTTKDIHIVHFHHRLKDDTTIFRSRRGITQELLKHHISFLRPK